MDHKKSFHQRIMLHTGQQSALAKRKMKMTYKGKRKDNYKKNKQDFDECCICYEKVLKSLDNSISCDKTIHIICASCKVKMKSTTCPMCRSHDVKQPIAQDIILPIYKKLRKPRDKYKGLKMSPKERRHYCRKGGPYDQPFGPNTNRINRQIRGWTTRGRTSYLFTYGSPSWLTEEQVLEYNGNLQTDYDSSDSSDLSGTGDSSDTDDTDDTHDTLSLAGTFTDDDDDDESLENALQEVLIDHYRNNI